MKCAWCQRDCDFAVYDGQKGLCDECARRESNRIYDNLLGRFESEEKLNRLAFAKYGIDDFAYSVDEETEE